MNFLIVTTGALLGAALAKILTYTGWLLFAEPFLALHFETTTFAMMVAIGFMLIQPAMIPDLVKNIYVRVIIFTVTVLSMIILAYPPIKYGVNAHQITTSTYLVDVDTKEIVEVIDILGDIKPVFRPKNNTIAIPRNREFYQNCEKKVIQDILQVSITVAYQLNDTDGSLNLYINSLKENASGKFESDICEKVLNEAMTGITIDQMNDMYAIMEKAEEIINAPPFYGVGSIVDYNTNHLNNEDSNNANRVRYIRARSH